MINCGIDESKQAGSSILVVSALVGQAAHMAKLTKRWNKNLDADNVDFFHAKDHWNGHYKPYHGLSQGKRKQLLRRFINHIHKYAQVGFSVCIDLVEYEKLVTSRFKSEWGSGYAFAVQLLLLLVYLDLEQKKQTHEVVNILIEDGHKNSRQALEIIANGKNKKDSHYLKIGTYGLAGKLGNPILQAADLLAYASGQSQSAGKPQMMSRLAYRAPFPVVILPWSPTLISAMKTDLDAHLASKTKRLRELKMW